MLSISRHIRFNDDKSVVTNFSYEDIISATLDLIMYSNNPQKILLNNDTIQKIYL